MVAATDQYRCRSESGDFSNRSGVKSLFAIARRNVPRPERIQNLGRNRQPEHVTRNRERQENRYGHARLAGSECNQFPIELRIRVRQGA